MTTRGFLLRRVLFAGFAGWLVLSITFVIFIVVPDSRLGGILGAAAFGGASETELMAIEQAYLAEHGYDRPVYVQYADWMYRMVTLQWGSSFISEVSVAAQVRSGLARTLLYVVPATLLAVGVGVAAGLYGALNAGSGRERALRLAIYLALGIPNFFVGLLAVLVIADPGVTMATWRTVLLEHVLPIVLLATTLVGAMVSYTRATASEYVDSSFIKLVRAKGGSEWRIAVHLLKNAAPPLFALVFAELLAVLLLGMFIIERVFSIDGFGALVLGSVHTRDLPVLLAGTLVVVFVGIGGNLLQDVVAAWLDPRVDES